MAKLTEKRRNALSASSFALPGRRYPIEDASHARNAPARASQHASPAEQATIRAKVHAKFPGIGKKSAPRSLAGGSADVRRDSRETRRCGPEHGYCMGASRV